MSSAKDNYGDPTAGSTIYIGLTGVLIFILTVIYLETLYYTTEETQRIEKNQGDSIRYRVEDVVEDQRTNLNTYRYDHAYNENTGRVTIPINDAVDLLLAEWPNPNMGLAGGGTGTDRVVSTDGTTDREGTSE